MSLVERLKARDLEWDRTEEPMEFTADDALLMQDAAAEIERLNAEVLKWQVDAGKFGPGMEAMEDLLAEEKAKCERLQAALVQIGILNASGGHFDIEIDRAIREAAEQIGG